MSYRRDITLRHIKRDVEFADERAAVLQRLATLRRLREQAEASNRLATLEAIDNLIEQECKHLRERDPDGEPA